MKQKIICCFSLIVVALLTTFLCLPPKDADILKNTKELKKQNVLAIMIETGEATDTYQESTSGSWPTDGYKFNRKLSRCTNGGELSWDKEKKIVSFSGNSDDKCYVYFDVGVESIADYCDTGTDLATCVKNFGDQGSAISNIYIHNSSLANGAGDNSYRYAGASDSVNNYICLGSDETTCPDANLFRIIGVFGDKTKVIRAKSVGDQKWHTSESNTWSSSSLNAYLNGTYLTSLGTIAEKIATTTWKVGGSSWSNIDNVVPATAYQYEVGTSASTTTVDKKIGLMYVSDYYYSASPSAWTLVGYNKSDATKDYSAAKTINWLYLGSKEWTISRVSDETFSAFIVDGSGHVFSYSVNFSNFAVRPSFNLDSTVTYVSGDGTKSNPIRIN